jgi:DNA-binding NarL/FixJ family response regulator
VCMDKAIRNVLVVGTEPSLHERLEPLLRRSHFDVDRVTESSAALSLIEAVAIDILVLSGSLTRPTVSELLEVIRSPGCPCHRSAVLVFCAPGDIPQGDEGNGRHDFTRFLSSDASNKELDEAVASLLRESPRLSVRLSIRIEAQLGNGSTMVLTQTENVSYGGMLVRMTRPLPTEAGLRFELLLPAGFSSVSGLGQVVRQTQDWKGRTTGVGMRFVAFDGGGKSALEGFLEREAE